MAGPFPLEEPPACNFSTLESKVCLKEYVRLGMGREYVRLGMGREGILHFLILRAPTFHKHIIIDNGY